jgi:hypothetical protein
LSFSCPAGALFYYQPEVQWNTLLTQRRRWINGTVCGFLFYFMSQRARSRVKGGLLDVHKPGRSAAIIDTFFGLQLLQLALVIACPAVFGLCSYLGVLSCSHLFSHSPIPVVGKVASLLLTDVYGPIRFSEVWIGFYLGFIGLWTYWSFTAPRGKMSEWLCQLVCIYCFIFVLPIYITIWYSIVVYGPGIVGSLVIFTLVLPIILSIAESVACVLFYLAFLPWFLFCGLFYLVFVPAYSFARLWDTTWGNRAGGKDSAINDKVEDFMKRQNMFLSIGLVTLNIILLWSFVKIFGVGGIVAMMCFLLVVFTPIFIQLFCAVFFMFILLPIRKVFGLTQGNKERSGGNIIGNNSSSFRQGNNSLIARFTPSGRKIIEGGKNDLGIDCDDENGICDVTSQTEFMEAIFPSSQTIPSDGSSAAMHDNDNSAIGYDDRSFWMNPLGNTSSFNILRSLELTPLIGKMKSDDDLKIPHRIPSATSSLGTGGVSALENIYDPVNSFIGHNPSSDGMEGGGGGVRRSKRIEVAGRYAKC